MSAKPPEELITRHEAFLDRDPVERPLVGLWLGGYYPAEQFPCGSSQWREGQTLQPHDVRMKDFAADYQSLYHIHQDADDDFFYVGSAYWGIPWLEAILGCRVMVGKATCWVGPCLQHLEETAALANDLDDNPWFECLAEFTNELVEFADGRFPVCPPLLRGPGDAAGAMRGAVALITDLIDNPELARSLLAHCAHLRLAGRYCCGDSSARRTGTCCGTL